MDLTRDQNGEPVFSEEKAEAIGKRFVELACLMEHLRARCPWDRRQTPDSLKRNILEEAYEVIETIEGQNWAGLREELGDFLLQVMFQAKLQQEQNRFDIEDVLAAIIEKMVRRHPHVFGSQTACDAEAVSMNWERIKQQEKGGKVSLFHDFPGNLPALLASYKVGRKAAKTGFDWPDPMQVLDKIEEEIGEIRQALADGDKDHVREELGDLLFAISNLVRKLDCEPEETLRAANRKFISRYQKMEQLAESDGIDFEKLDLDSQEKYWERAKTVMRGEET